MLHKMMPLSDLNEQRWYSVLVRKNSSVPQTPRRALGGRRGGGVLTVTHRVWVESDPKENFVRAPTRPRGGAERGRGISEGAEGPK